MAKNNKNRPPTAPQLHPTNDIDLIRSAAAVWPVLLPGPEVIAAGCPDPHLRDRYSTAYEYYLSQSRAGRIFKGKPCVYYAGARWHLFIPVEQDFKPDTVRPSLAYLAQFQSRLKINSIFVNNRTDKGDEILQVIEQIEDFPFTVYFPRGSV